MALGANENGRQGSWRPCIRLLIGGAQIRFFIIPSRLYGPGPAKKK